MCCSARQRRGHEHGHLLAVGDRDVRGAQRDFRLAEADVAADKAIHRPPIPQVGDHGVDGRLLVGRLLEREAFGERFVVVRTELERVSRARCAAARKG
jgi:hypothetical protein